jgi:hypothetical protein
MDMKAKNNNTTSAPGKTLTAILCLTLGLLALPAYAVTNELVGSAESHSIEKFDSTGNWVKTFASTGPYYPVGIAASPLTGDVFAATLTATVLRAVYAMQSAENWLEDAGSGQLSSGSARIELDPAFAQTVNAGVEYHVFLTPNGDSKGLYVSQKTATSFEVHEQGGGASSIAFDYRIMAKRKGYENVRLEDLTGRFQQPPAPLQKMRRPPSAKAKTAPVTPTPSVQPQVQLLVAPRVPEAPKLLPAPAIRTGQAGKPEVDRK